MAVQAPELINNWWVYLRDSMGSTYLNPNDKQIHNAYRLRSALRAQGYDDYAIAGMIGNAQVESSITTGAIERPSALPNGGENIADVPNSYMIQYYTPPQGLRGWALGVFQWDGQGSYGSHKLVGWCDANGYDWYDGVGQMARLDFEFQNDATYHFWTQNYQMTWAEFKEFHTSRPSWGPDDAADVWASNWELSSLDPSGRQQRKDNALFWFQYFIDHPFEHSPVWLLAQYNKQKVRGLNVRKRISV